ncbi:MAG: TetR/AcrR family transcriptional regulator [Actinomycetes bacterium]
MRTAVLDAAATLFALRGIDAVSLRDIAAEADVNLTLIRRYIGNREDLITEVFEYVSVQLAQAVEDHPLAGQGFTPDTIMGKWVRIAASMTLSGRTLPGAGVVNPVQAMAHTIMVGYEVSDETARVRAAQVTAAALGWRIFEQYLVHAGGLDGIPIELLRDDLVHSARRLGATVWPSPPDPPAVVP